MRDIRALGIPPDYEQDNERVNYIPCSVPMPKALHASYAARVFSSCRRILNGLANTLPANRSSSLSQNS